MKEYNLKKIINQCGDCKDYHYNYLVEEEKGYAECLRINKIIEIQEESPARKPFKCKSGIGWFPKWCPLENVIEESNVRTYLIKSTNHVDNMRCIIVEAENETEMKTLVKRFNRLYCWDEDLYELHSFVEISDSVVRNLFEFVNKEIMKELEDENARLYNHTKK